MLTAPAAAPAAPSDVSTEARVAAQREEWAVLEGSPGEGKRRATDGLLRHSLLRSLCWRMFLGALDNNPGKWEGQLQDQRRVYDEHIGALWLDPHAVDQDVALNNPLSQEQNSAWNQFFRNQELQEEIQKDLERLYPEYPFFQTPATQDTMMRILFVWARLHPAISYRQGMHELLAPIVWVVTKEAIPLAPDAPANDTLGLALDGQFIAHDAFTLFSYLMQTMAPLFEVHQRPPHSHPHRPHPHPPAAQQDGPPQTPVLRRCGRVFGLLKSRDPDLYKHLVACEVEPQMFLLRWLRCLFGREFHLEDVMVLWDAVFADSAALGLADYVCVAMMKFVRSDLMANDQSYCYRRLMKFPPVENVHDFVKHALVLRDPAQAQARIPQRKHTDPLMAPATKRVVGSRSPKYGQRIGMRLGFKANNQSAHTDLVSYVHGVEHLHSRMAHRLHAIVGVLEEAAAAGESFDQTKVLVAIAQLKQATDILNGQLPVEHIDLIESLEQQEQEQRAHNQDGAGQAPRVLPVQLQEAEEEQGEYEEERGGEGQEREERGAVEEGGGGGGEGQQEEREEEDAEPSHVSPSNPAPRSRVVVGGGGVDEADNNSNNNNNDGAPMEPEAPNQQPSPPGAHPAAEPAPSQPPAADPTPAENPDEGAGKPEGEDNGNNNGNKGKKKAKPLTLEETGLLDLFQPVDGKARASPGLFSAPRKKGNGGDLGALFGDGVGEELFGEGAPRKKDAKEEGGGAARKEKKEGKKGGLFVDDVEDDLFG